MKPHNDMYRRIVCLLGLISGLGITARSQADPLVYTVQIQGSGTTPSWIVGSTASFKGINRGEIVSHDNGATLSGVLVYQGEQTADLKGKRVGQNQYSVQITHSNSGRESLENWIFGTATASKTLASLIFEISGGPSLISGAVDYNGGKSDFFKMTLNPPGSPISKAELELDRYSVPSDFNAPKPPAIPGNPTPAQLSAYNSNPAVSGYHTKLARYAWRLFIAANNGTAATLSDGSRRETPVASFLDTGISPLYNGGNNPLIFEGYYHRTEAYPYYQNTEPPSQALKSPLYRFQAGFTVSGRQANYVNLDESNQISQNMLYYRGARDPNFPVLYMAKVNRTELDYAYRNNPLFKPNSKKSWVFPDGVVEIKAAWRRVSDFRNASDAASYHQAQATYYVGAEGTTSPAIVTNRFALIALHIIQKTENYPQFIFSTFEHVNASKTDNPQFQLLYTLLAYGAGDKLTADAYGAYTNNVPGLPAKPNELTNISLPPAGNAPGNLIDHGYNVIEQPQTITREVNDVNNEVYKLLLEAAPKSIWANYRLKGVQSMPTSTEGTRDFFLANIVVETSRPGVQLFRGTVINPTTNGVPAPNKLFTNNRSNGNITLQELTYGKPVPPAGVNMGGCMGCHGVAQQKGRDFSFLASGAHGKGKSVDSVPRDDLSPGEKSYHNALMAMQRVIDAYK